MTKKPYTKPLFNLLTDHAYSLQQLGLQPIEIHMSTLDQDGEWLMCYARYNMPRKSYDVMLSVEGLSEVQMYELVILMERQLSTRPFDPFHWLAQTAMKAYPGREYSIRLQAPFEVNDNE